MHQLAIIDYTAKRKRLRTIRRDCEKVLKQPLSQETRQATATILRCLELWDEDLREIEDLANATCKQLGEIVKQTS